MTKVFHDGVQGSNLPDLPLDDVHVVSGGEVVFVGTAQSQVVKGHVLVTSMILLAHAVSRDRNTQRVKKNAFQSANTRWEIWRKYPFFKATYNTRTNEQFAYLLPAGFLWKEEGTRLTHRT